jgi:hypothetical protein
MQPTDVPPNVSFGGSDCTHSHDILWPTDDIVLFMEVQK